MAESLIMANTCGVGAKTHAGGDEKQKFTK